MGHRATIVVVDDSEEIRDTLQLVLEREGYRVLPCAEADEAFAVVQRERPDIVITDIVLGVESGLDLITRLRSDLAAAPAIVACSGFPGFAEEAQRRGAAAFLPKPFELEALRDAVTAAFARAPISPEVFERADRGARRLRAKAVETAQFAIERLEPRRAELEKRSIRSMRFLADYLGMGEALTALVQDGHLRVFARSSLGGQGLGELVDERLPLCRDIVETGSAIVLPDVSVFPAAVRATGNLWPVRFFAGVPLYSDRVAIGAVCLVDEQPRRACAEDMALLEAIGRRASAVLSDEEEEGPPPLWDDSGMISREGFHLFANLELKRAQRRDSWVQLLCFASKNTDGCAGWSDDLARVVSPRRTLLAQLGGRRFGLVVCRDDERTSELALAAAVERLRARAGLVCGGLISVNATGLPILDARELIDVALALLARERRMRHDEIVRIAVRAEPWRERSVRQIGV